MILLCDDLGYGDLGCYGNRAIRTPNIDRAAAEGARLTEFYATPTCTPSRAALLTGRYPIRSGLTRVLVPTEHFGIPDAEVTLAEALKVQGYRTACIGKWHLGNRPPYRPTKHGFDHFYGLLYSNDMTLPVVHWPPIKLFRGDRPVESPVEQRTLTARLTAEALRFIAGSRSDPFLMYVPYTMPHLPWTASSDFAGKSAYGAYGDAVEEIDWSVGEILKALARHGLDEDTVVIFLSDNGPEVATPRPGGSTGGLRGGKGATWEGGVRVPCVIRWPGQVPAGIVRPGITCIMDLFATALELARVDVPRDHAVDGRNLMPFLKGEAPPPHSEHYYYRGKRLFAVRSGAWKLHLWRMQTGKHGKYRRAVMCDSPELYNLEKDPGERQDVAGKNHDLVARLRRLAADFEGAMEPGKPPPPQWRSVLPRLRGGGKRQG